MFVKIVSDMKSGYIKWQMASASMGNYKTISGAEFSQLLDDFLQNCRDAQKNNIKSSWKSLAECDKIEINLAQL